MVICVYKIGSGIAGLSSAVFLIRDGKISGENIYILEEANLFGGSLDSAGSGKIGYSMRGGRMFEAHFGCTYDLLSGITSIDDTQKTVKQEIFDFYEKASWY